MAITSASTATSLTFAAPYAQSDGNSQGQTFGNSPSDKISFYGNTPIIQPTAGAAGIFAVYDTGQFTKYQLTNVTTSITTSTSAEISTTVCTGLQTTDVVAVNKPSATGGIGLSGYRVSAANKVGLSYVNISSGTVTTSAEAYDIIGVSSSMTVTTALTPAAVPTSNSGSSEQFFTVPGATMGSVAMVNKPTNQAGLVVGNVRVSAENQVAITYHNVSSGTITPTAAETYSFAFLPTLAPASNILNYNYSQVSTAVAASSAIGTTQTLTGLQTTDVVMGISKPTIQAGLGIAGYYVSSANTIGLMYMNVSSAVTSTGETYAVSVMRPIARAPLQVTTVSLAPVSVAATTTAEQTFTVNFLAQASTSVLVNKPSLTPGISIVNARVSAASTLAITYLNTNTTAVIPPTESYMIGYVNLQGPGAVATTGTSNSIVVGVNLLTSAVKDMKAAMTTLGLNSAT